MTLTELIREKAYDLGFDLMGVAPASRAPHADAFASWVEAGFAASMGYMKRNIERRQDPRQVLPGARSVVVVGLSYFTVDPADDLWNDPSRGRISRYAWGPDYHDVLIRRLDQLAAFIARNAHGDIRHRAYVDTGPVLERDFAAQAGLGFIGKNTCLISPTLGSYLFLGEVLVNVDLEYDAPAANAGERIDVLCSEVPQGTQLGRQPTRSPRRRVGSCGACTRCLTACPTGALMAPYILDSSRCISYLTIELKGTIPSHLRPSMGNWIFGCDECQSICPWPRRFARPTGERFIQNDPEWCAPRLLDLIAMDERAFQARFAGGPVLRAKRRGLLRNVAIALANWGDPQAMPALQRATEDPEPLVREHAAWAMAHIRLK